MLLTHVLDFYGEQLTEFQSGFQCLVRLVGVHMHLDDVIIFHDNQTVANAVEERAQALYIARLVAALCDKLGAVGKGNIFILNIAEGRAALCFRLRLCDFALLVNAVVCVAHAFQHCQKTKAAGIDNARLFQHRILVRGLSQRFVTLFQRSTQHISAACIRIGLAQLNHVLCCHAGHGQNRALCRLHDCLVCGLHAFLQRKCQILTIGFLAGFELLGHAAEQQGQNDAGVSARTAQQSRSGHLACSC